MQSPIEITSGLKSLWIPWKGSTPSADNIIGHNSLERLPLGLINTEALIFQFHISVTAVL